MSATSAMQRWWADRNNRIPGGSLGGLYHHPAQIRDGVPDLFLVAASTRLDKFLSIRQPVDTVFLGTDQARALRAPASIRVAVCICRRSSFSG